jgi:hypothetical protein
MKIISIRLAVASLATGLMAALRWYLASRIEPGPEWRFEPNDATLKRMGWDARTLRAFAEAGQLNAAAGLWTAASVVLRALSSIVSVVF